MKSARNISYFLSIGLLVSMLSACGYTRPAPAPQYRPLTSDLASMAAPASPDAVSTVYCRVALGQAKFGKQWHEFGQTAFILGAGQRTNVTLRSAKSSGTAGFQGIFDSEGQKLIFCPLVQGPPDQEISCASLYMLEDDLKMGLKRTFDIPESIIGSTVSCAAQDGRQPAF